MTQKTASKFTPGPWVTVSGLPTLINSGGMRPAREPYRSIASTHMYKGDATLEDEANARLITRAPEMYELLELVTSAQLRYSAEGIGSFGPTDSIRWQDIQSLARRIKAEIDREGQHG